LIPSRRLWQCVLGVACDLCARLTTPYISTCIWERACSHFGSPIKKSCTLRWLFSPANKVTIIPNKVTIILNKTPTRCTINLKVFKIYLPLYCSTCFGHYCAHHQEPLLTAHAASGHRVLSGWMLPPVLFGYHSVPYEPKFGGL
jgi:hypothetical protein